ncbi:hypothetical protein IEE94_08605 [Yimella sp. cx-573]|nr:hypothetical protein [Yimella sp. cx-573]
MGVNELSDEEFTALYGQWANRTPQDVKEFFEGYGGLWWIAGGWALEAFTGVRRSHDDIDPSVLSAELPLLRRHLAGKLHAWAASSGSLTPLLPEDAPDAAAEDVLPAGAGQLWARRSAADPWEYDILLAPGSRDEWIYKRNNTIRLPMAEAVWEQDGIRYLQPQIQLLYKAKGLRTKDQADFAATLPHLDGRRRDWLQDALERTIPDHPWIDSLSGGRSSSGA